MDSKTSNEVAAASPQVVDTTKGDKIRDFLTTKKIQSWVGLAEVQKKVRPMASPHQISTIPRLWNSGADWLTHGSPRFGSPKKQTNTLKGNERMRIAL